MSRLWGVLAVWAALEEEADFLVKLSHAIGGTAHIIVTDGCL